MRILGVSFLSIVVGCSSAGPAPPDVTLDAGTIDSVEFVARSWNVEDVTIVRTSKQVFGIPGRPKSIPLGAQCWHITRPDGQEFLRVEGEEKVWPLGK